MQGSNLMRAREAAGLTIRELSRRSGVHPATIADIEKGRNARPSYDKVVLLARALGVEPSVLWDPTAPAAEETASPAEQEAAC